MNIKRMSCIETVVSEASLKANSDNFYVPDEDIFVI
jgi:hypothetical protein